MPTLTIPKELMKKGGFIVIPRKEYEEFSNWRKLMDSLKTFTPTNEEKRELKKAREDYKKRKYLTIDELRHKLEINS